MSLSSTVTATTTTNVPRIAAQWVVFQLPSRCGIVDNIEQKGLCVLNVKELKSLETILNSISSRTGEATIRQNNLPKSAKKQQRVDYLQRFFFLDDPCTIVNRELLQLMQSEMTSGPSSTTDDTLLSSTSDIVTSSQATIHSNISRANNALSLAFAPSGNSSTGNLQIPMPLSFSSLNNPFLNNYNPWSSIPPSYSETGSNNNYSASSLPHLNALTATHHCIHHSQNIAPTHDQQQQQHIQVQQQQQQQQNANNNNSVNPESSSRSDNLPQTPNESRLLSQLLEMGFGNQEILDEIRQSANQDPTTDEIMLILIQRREDAEEARNVDEARLLSEGQKQEESNRRERTLQDSIENATTKDDLMVIFPSSWVLEVMTNNGHLISIIMTRSKSRNDFVEFLQLEKKSRKWYGFVLPSDYFLNVGTRLKSEIPNIDWLGAEREKLRCGLFELKEQEKGEPKIFVDARKEKQMNTKNEIIIIDDD